MFSKLFWAALLAAMTLSAQSINAVVSGTVTDPTGASIPGASITVTNAATNVVAWKGQTDGAGFYTAPALPVGTYNLTFEAPGFKRYDVTALRLNVDQRARIDASLQPGEVRESVTVTGESVSPVQTENSSMGDVMQTRQVRDLPLPSRNVLNLLSLVGGTSSGGAATGINANQMSINGSRTLNSEFTVDGVSVVSGSTGGLTRLPSTEALREFRVLTSGYSAEYGRTSGGSINAIVDSGTNTIHGGAYEFFRNEALNANDFFRNARGEQRQQDRYNQFGAKLGGPVFIPKLYNGKDRTFFFFNYEGLRRRQPSSQISTVPDAAYRTGDFSASPIPIIDPLTGQQFPGNRIPTNRIDPAAARILGLIPAANSPGTADVANNRTINNLVINQPSAPSNNEITTRVDHNIGSATRVFARWTRYSNFDPIQSVLPGPLENAVGTSNTIGHQASLGWTQTWTPTLLSEVNLGFMRDDPRIDPPSLGINVANVLGIQRSVGGASPRLNISGYQELGINSNTYRRQLNNNYQLAASVSRISGSHIMKFGAQVRKNQFNVFNPGGLFTGQYSFTGEITSATRTGGNPINALADFMLGDIKTSQYELFQPPTGRRNMNWALFFQDDWKVNRKLTLNLGLRYEYESPMTMSNNIYSRLDPTTGRLLVAGQNASDTLNLEGDRINLAPRVGFAYSLNDKTVIRSAFGMFYSQIFSNLGGQVAYPGFTVRQSFQNLGVGVPQPFTLSQGMPLIAAQNLRDPFFVERQASTSNPLAGGAEFGQVSPLPYSMQWNFGIQRELPAKILLDTSYVASRGVHLPLSLPFNQVPYERGTEVAQAGNAVYTQNARPFPTVAGFGAFVHAGTSSYHSLQVRANRQIAASLAFQAVYTWSKSIDDGSGLFSFSQPNGVDGGQFPNLFRYLDRGVSAFDRPHSFAAAFQYTTRGPVWARNWQFNPIFIARNGLPDTINQNNLHPSASQQRPNVINDNAAGYAPKMTSEGTAIRYLLSPSDPSFPFTPTGPLFTGTGASRRLVLPFTGPGTLGRNTTREPNEFNVDLSVARIFPITERLRFTIRAEAFNLFNHTNFNGPNTGLSVIADPRSGAPVWNSPNFGLITSAKSARFMQFVARFDF